MMEIKVEWNKAGIDEIDNRFKLMPGAIAMIVEAIAIYGEGRMKQHATLPGQYRTMLIARMISVFTWVVGATGKARAYAHFLNDGTDESRGKWLPFFEKRFSKTFLDAHPAPYKDNPTLEELFIGIHPGNKGKVGPMGLRFFEKAVDDMGDNAERIGTQVVRTLLNQGSLGVQ